MCAFLKLYSKIQRFPYDTYDIVIVTKMKITQSLEGEILQGFCNIGGGQCAKQTKASVRIQWMPEPDGPEILSGA
jgi:hypothetical protein